MIGANIRKGECETFPSDSRGQVGYGIRGPGTWNPNYDAFSLIAYQNVRSLFSANTAHLALRARGERKRISLSYRSNNGVDRTDLTYRGEFGQWQARFAITTPRTRHEKLKEMVNHIFRQVGREVAPTKRPIAIQRKDRRDRCNSV